MVNGFKTRLAKDDKKKQLYKDFTDQICCFIESLYLGVWYICGSNFVKATYFICNILNFCFT